MGSASDARPRLVRFSLGIYNNRGRRGLFAPAFAGDNREAPLYFAAESQYPDNTSYDVEAARIKHEQDSAGAFAEKDSETVSA